MKTQCNPCQLDRPSVSGIILSIGRVPISFALVGMFNVPTSRSCICLLQVTSGPAMHSRVLCYEHSLVTEVSDGSGPQLQEPILDTQ